MPASALSPGWPIVAAAIDHTLLRTEATHNAIAELCEQARQYQFHAVCIQPGYVELASHLLRGTGVSVATVIGFPQGATLTTVKRFEASEALRLGAAELDMVINIGRLKQGERDCVRDEIQALAEAAHENGCILKTILETCLLTGDEKRLACELALEAGADFVKTSTGMAGGGATQEDVKLLRSIVGDRAGVKASGGIRTAADAITMLAAGANRLGTSASVRIVRELGAPEQVY